MLAVAPRSTWSWHDKKVVQCSGQLCRAAACRLSVDYAGLRRSRPLSSRHMLDMLHTVMITEDYQTVTQCHHGHADIAHNQLVNGNLMFFWYL